MYNYVHNLMIDDKGHVSVTHNEWTSCHEELTWSFDIAKFDYYHTKLGFHNKIARVDLFRHSLQWINPNMETVYTQMIMETR